MPRFLLWSLWAPLAAMGEIAVGERRTGFDRPARSALAGLLAAALGVERREEARLVALAAGYGFAIRTDAPGTILYDYHTAQVPSRQRGVSWPTRRHELSVPALNTILSKREYRESPWFTIAAWARADAPVPLDELAAALERPRFTLYFGRKACPLGVPPWPRVVEQPDLGRAFAAYDGALPNDLRRLRARICRPAPVGRVHLDPDPGVPLGPGLFAVRLERRRDRLVSRRRWQYGLRDELVAEPREVAP